MKYMQIKFHKTASIWKQHLSFNSKTMHEILHFYCQ